MIDPLPCRVIGFTEDLDRQYSAGEVETDYALEGLAGHIEKSKVAVNGGVGTVAASAVDQNVDSSPIV